MFYSRKYILFVLVALGILGSFAIRKLSADGPTVVMNELLWMGSSTSSSDEWIELRNLTNQSVDVSGWKLTKKSSGAETTMLFIPAGKAIEPLGYFLIANYADTNASSTLNVAPDVVNSDVALANSALQIKLYDAAGNLIDTADDGVGNPLSGRFESANQIYYSMERNRIPGDGTMAASWHVARSAANFDAGKPEFGTPRLANTNALPAVEIGIEMTGVIGEPVNFDASDSFDPDGDALSFAWDFGDGFSGSGPAPSHAYGAAGGYTAVIRLTDGYDTVTGSIAVTISPPPAAPPSANVNSNSNGNTNTTGQNAKTLTSCRGLLLNELFPNPAGVDDGEFVELINPTNQAVPLTGCKLWINDKRVYTLTGGQVPARGYFVAEKSITKLSLTNDGGKVQLNDSDGVVLDHIDFPKAKEGQAWARFGEIWGWTEAVTPGAENVEPTEGLEALNEEADTNSGNATKKSSSKNAKIPLAVDVGDIQELESGDRVSFSASVTAPVDALGSRVTFAQDDTGAVSILLAEGAIKPKVGDVIEIIGTVRSYQGRKRVSVKKDEIVITGHDQIVTPREIELAELGPESADYLVRVSGVIGSSSGTKISIDDGTAEGAVAIKSSTGIIKPKMITGDRLVAIGIVNVSTTGIRVWPRTLEDLRVERVLGASVSKDAQTKSLPTSNPQQRWWYWGLVGLGALAAGAKPAWQAWKKYKAQKIE